MYIMYVHHVCKSCICILYVRMYIHTCTYIHTYVRMYIHCTYMYMCTYVCVSFFLGLKCDITTNDTSLYEY